MSRTIDDLSPREREIADLISRGLGANEIAGELKISTNTVRKHLKTAYLKLDVRSAAQLSAMVTEAKMKQEHQADLEARGIAS